MGTLIFIVGCCHAVFLLFSVTDISSAPGFPPPTFRSEWLDISTENESTSYFKIEHNIGSVPILVKVLVKALDGDNKDFIFEAYGSSQVDDDYPIKRGGVLFTYDANLVYVWVSTIANDVSETYAIVIGGLWGSGVHSQYSMQATMQVLAWSSSDFYKPDFISEHLEMSRASYGEVQHSLGSVPDLVVVVGSFEDSGIHHHFVGTGSQQNGFYTRGDNIGGVLFAYNNDSVRLWATNARNVFTTDDGQSFRSYVMDIPTAHVQVFVWADIESLSTPALSVALDVNQSVTTYYEFGFNPCSTDLQVNVRLMAVDGINEGFYFPGEGMAHSEGSSGPASIAGGAVFAYSRDTIRIWLLEEFGNRTGIIAAKRWGGDNNQQLSSVGKLRVRVFCSPYGWTARRFPERETRFRPIRDIIDHQTQLIAFNVTQVSSPHECFRLCAEELTCAGLSWETTTCRQFAELEFGESGARDNDQVMYLVERNKCQPECSFDP